MLSKEKLEALKYLKQEYNNLQNDPIISLGCTVGLINNNDIFHWKISLMGPSDTPYAGGMFFLTADFPDNYPIGKPEVKFINKIYHLNVSPFDGHVCISTLNRWKPRTPFYDIMTSIFALFYAANPESPFGLHIKQEFEQDRNKYDTKAKYFTEKYAIPSFSSKNLDRWDFTYNN